MKAFVVIGLGFGDEGKGSIVDWLTREEDSTLTVRFNGGAQAAHHVVTPEGQEHTFHMFGSGTFAGADTYLSQHVLVNPELIAVEASELIDLGIINPLRRLFIHQDAPITTPFHVALNRLKEMSRGNGHHGSCGLGIGETMVDVLAGKALTWKELLEPNKLYRRLKEIADEKYGEALELHPPQPPHAHDHWFTEMQVLRAHHRTLDEILDTYKTVAKHTWTGVGVMPTAETVIFEGAQGVLIDQKYGQAPFHTWSDCTPHNALEILKGKEATILGVTRAYMTRHGAGSFPTETDHPFVQPDNTNEINDYQGKLRYGWPDLQLLRYAARACRQDGGLDALAITCLDQLRTEVLRVGDDVVGPVFDLERVYYGMHVGDLPAAMIRAADTPQWALSIGPTAADKAWSFQDVPDQ